MCNHDNHFIFNQSLASKIGVDAAIVLQKISYWINCSGKEVNGEKGEWIYNSLEEWHKQFSFWSLSKLRKIIKNLETKKLIIAKKINSKRWNQTKWYSINAQSLSILIQNTKFSFSKKKTDRFVQNEQMLLKKTKNNYTNKSSYREEKLFLKKNKVRKKTSKTANNTISLEEESIAKQMVRAWNDQFEFSLNPVKAFTGKNVVIQLNKVLQTKFENNLDHWNLYAKAVNSSKFLMGEKETKSNFKAQFLWLIKEETIDSIKNGAYGVGDRVLDSEQLDQNLKVCQKEVQQLLQDKVATKIKEKASSNNEEKEFKQYLIRREYEKDGDKYLLQKHMESIGSQYMYGGYITPSHVFYSGNEKYKKRLFQSYLMKKYYGVDETCITSSFSKVAKDVDCRSMLLTLKNIKEKLKFGVSEDTSHHCGFFGTILQKVDSIQGICMVS